MKQSWPTQPFPTVIPPFSSQRFTVNDINPYLMSPAERESWRTRIAVAGNEGLFTPPTVGVETVSIPGAQGGANWGTTAAHPTDGSFYVVGINVPSIYKLGLEPPGAVIAVGARSGGSPSAALIAAGRITYQARCIGCHGADLRGVGTYPSLVDVGLRIGPETLREVIAAGRLSMPPNVMMGGEMDGLLAFLSTPSATTGPAAGRGAGAPATSLGGPVVASGVAVPSTRYYTDYGMVNTLVKPPYSLLTAYDLNTGTIKWQVPAGGDEPRTVAEGGQQTGYPRSRAGIVTTATGLLFHAGFDGKLRVYQAVTGALLRTLDLTGGSSGIPAMYEVNGRQYIVVNATQTLAG